MGPNSPSLTSPTTPAVAAAPPRWPLFTGLPDASVTAGADGDRVVVAGYTTHPNTTNVDPATVATYLLNPATGQYVRHALDLVLAVSPDLRYAVVARHHAINTSTQAGVYEYGVYDTVNGRAVGRIDVDPWAPPGSERFVWSGDWSPDGGSIVLSVRLAEHGRGWLADRIIVVDVLTGSTRGVDLGPAQGFEPLELLGFTADSRRVALTADPVGTDQTPSAHIVYDLTGTPTSVHRWPRQSEARLAIGFDELLLMPTGSGNVAVVDLATGATEHQYPTEPIRSISGWESPLSWRPGMLIDRYQDCVSGDCTAGPRLLGVTPTTGAYRTLFTLPASTQHIYLGPGGSLTGTTAGLAW